MKICFTKKKKNKTTTKKKRHKSFQRRESNSGPPTCRVDALSIAPRQLISPNRVKLIIFKTFAHEILPVDAVWSPQSVIYEELKDIFEENKHGFDS